MATHNPGYITSSTVKRLLTGKGDKLLQGGKTFARQIARERFGVEDPNSAFGGNAATEWGNYHEDEAIAAYEAQHFVSVHSGQVGVADGWLSCLPDGLVGTNGIAEVKCHFKTDKHMDNLLEDKWVSAYEAQCRFQMMLTGRDWCDLISYDPRWPERMNLHSVRLEREDEWEEFCHDRIEQAEEIIADIIAKLGSS
jgi:hypothetical protein